MLLALLLLATDGGSSMDLNKLVGTRVELTGIAENGKGGALLLVGGSHIYLRKLDSWPMGQRGKQVVVKGILKSLKLIPSPVRGPNGEISQGAEGDQWVLDDATF